MYAQYMNYIPESARRISINNQVYQCNIIKWNCVRSKLEAMTKKNTRDSTTTEEFVRKSGDNWKKNTRGTEKREKTICVFFCSMHFSVLPKSIVLFVSLLFR